MIPSFFHCCFESNHPLLLKHVFLSHTTPLLTAFLEKMDSTANRQGNQADVTLCIVLLQFSYTFPQIVLQ